MKLSIIETKDNVLMKRKEAKVLIDHEGGPTPSRYEMVGELSKVLKSGKDNIIISKIFGVRGLDKSEAKVMVYEDKKDIPKALIEKMNRRTKAPKQEEKAEDSQPAEEPAEAAASEGSDAQKAEDEKKE
ncbi:MAG: hypothetical protein GXO64_02040 [Candidatus Micrarchaeota archaeon]|nr:hypothetical protein [Candidatus Micrarchaeota archaeon]